MKNSIYLFKWPLIFLLAGFLTRIVGALMKILHWQGADVMLIVATVIMCMAILWLIAKLVLLKQNL